MHRPTNPSPRTGGPASDSPLTAALLNTGRITHSEMTAAIAAGTARTLSQTITDIARHQNSWWLYDRDEWLQVDDAALAADLDAASDLMTAADQQVRMPRKALQHQASQCEGAELDEQSEL